MTLELSLMAASALVMAGILAHNHAVRARGLRSRLGGVAQKTDPLFEGASHATTRIVSQITLRNFVVLLNHIFVGIVRFCMHVSRRVHDTSARVVERASRKKEDLSRSGAASFYLKKIKETKEEVQTAGK